MLDPKPDDPSMIKVIQNLLVLKHQLAAALFPGSHTSLYFSAIILCNLLIFIPPYRPGIAVSSRRWRSPFKFFFPCGGESSPPSVLEAQVTLKVVLTNPGVDFSISRLLLVGVLVDEACSQFLAYV